jgi:hypothetical protein
MSRLERHFLRISMRYVRGLQHAGPFLFNHKFFKNADPKE